MQILDTLAGAILAIALGLGTATVMPRPKPEIPPQQEPASVPAIEIRQTVAPAKTGAKRVDDLTQKVDSLAVEQRSLIRQIKDLTEEQRKK